jgi:hypothetical protein
MTMKALILPTLFLLFTSSQAPAEMSYSRVAIRAQIITPKIDGEFENDQMRQSFLKELEEQVAAAANKKFPCMEWQVGWSASEPSPKAELWVRVTDDGDLANPKILLAYAGNYGTPTPERFDSKKLEQVLVQLPDEFTLSLLETAKGYYVGDLGQLRYNFGLELRKQFRRQDFEKAFNTEFISNVVIAEDLGFVDESHEVIVPILVRRMCLEPGASLSARLEKAPRLCSDGFSDCTISLVSTSVAYDKKWPGGLKCRFQNNLAGCCDCCNPTWTELTSGSRDAQRRAVSLKEHKHLPSCWDKDGIYGQPE